MWLYRGVGSVVAATLWIVSSVAVPAEYTPSTSAWAADGCERHRIADIPLGLQEMNVPRAWQRSTGKGVTVAVVDSGVQRSEFFPGQSLLDGVDLTAGKSGSTSGARDIFSHGTIVASLAAARPRQDQPPIGVAKDAVILPVRTYGWVDTREARQATDPRGEAIGESKVEDPNQPQPTAEQLSAARPSMERVAEGIKWAADHGARVIIVAQSSSSTFPALEQAVKYATSKQALIVASGGNVWSTKNTQDVVKYPANSPGVLGVTSVDAAGAPPASVVHGSHVKVAAPGQCARAVTLQGDKIDYVGSPEAASSWSTGYVGGVAALVASAYPDESPAEWEYRILATARRPRADVQTPALGWGVVDAAAALDFVNDGSRLGPPNPLTGVRPVKPNVPPATLESGLDDRLPLQLLLLAAAGIVGAVMVALLLAHRLRRMPRP